MTGTTQDEVGTAGPLAPSYEDFVAARSGPLLRTAYLLTGSTHDAEDLLQTTLVKLYVGWRTVRAARSPEAYAHRVMTNAFISGRRPARWHRERLVERMPDPPAPPPDTDGALDLADHLRALAPRQRAVVVLRYYDGLSEAEIAAALGVSPGTVKSTASRALARLRERMEEGS